MEKEEREQSNQELKSLIAKREEFYQEIKKKLTPLILHLIRAREKTHGYKNYWELYDELEIAVGLERYDYERLIWNLESEKILRKSWSAGIGAYLTRVKT